MCVCFSESWQYVFSDLKRKKPKVLIVATSFQVYMKVETEKKYELLIEAEETQGFILSIEKFRPAALQ